MTTERWSSSAPKGVEMLPTGLVPSFGLEEVPPGRGVQVPHAGVRRSRASGAAFAARRWRVRGSQAWAEKTSEGKVQERIGRAVRGNSGRSRTDSQEDQRFEGDEAGGT